MPLAPPVLKLVDWHQWYRRGMKCKCLQLRASGLAVQSRFGPRKLALTRKVRRAVWPFTPAEPLPHVDSQTIGRRAQLLHWRSQWHPRTRRSSIPHPFVNLPEIGDHRVKRGVLLPTANQKVEVAVFGRIALHTGPFSRASRMTALRLFCSSAARRRSSRST